MRRTADHGHHSGEHSIAPSATTCVANVLAQRYIRPDVCYVRQSKGQADPSAAPIAADAVSCPSDTNHGSM